MCLINHWKYRTQALYRNLATTTWVQPFLCLAIGAYKIYVLVFFDAPVSWTWCLQAYRTWWIAMLVTSFGPSSLAFGTILSVLHNMDYVIWCICIYMYICQAVSFVLMVISIISPRITKLKWKSSWSDSYVALPLYYIGQGPFGDTLSQPGKICGKICGTICGDICREIKIR